MSRPESAADLASKVAIVVVTYRRANLLAELLKSFAALDPKPGRIFIVDNASHDDTRDTVESYRDSVGADRLVYTELATNTGGSGGFSAGVEQAYASGAEWIWVMDDDVAVEPDALAKLAPWMQRFKVVQGCRYDYDGSAFYWQYRFWTALGIPSPIAPSGFDASNFKIMNTMCFEGGMFHRDIVKQIGIPDPRFFIYWDDTVYGYLASQVTTPVLVNEYIMHRTREMKQWDMGVRHLNGTSDMVRYYIMRNRGYMARYFAEHGDYRPLMFALGTLLTFAKECIRLAVIDKSFRTGLPRLLRGMRDARALRRNPAWKPMPPLD